MFAEPVYTDSARSREVTMCYLGTAIFSFLYSALLLRSILVPILPSSEPFLFLSYSFFFNFS